MSGIDNAITHLRSGAVGTNDTSATDAGYPDNPHYWPIN